MKSDERFVKDPQDRSLEVLRSETLVKIADIFKSDEQALAFIDQHTGDIQEVLYWLEAEREYIFELLIHDVTITSAVNIKRDEVTTIAREMLGLNNGALEALRKRLAKLQPKPETAPLAQVQEMADEVLLAPQVTPREIPKEDESASTPIVPDQKVVPVTTPDSETTVTAAHSRLEKAMPNIREVILGLIVETQTKPEFSNPDFISGSQISRAYPRIKGRFLDVLVEEEVISLIPSRQRRSNKGFTHEDLVLAILIHDNQINGPLRKALKKIVKEVREEYLTSQVKFG